MLPLRAFRSGSISEGQRVTKVGLQAAATASADYEWRKQRSYWDLPHGGTSRVRPGLNCGIWSIAIQLTEPGGTQLIRGCRYITR